MRWTHCLKRAEIGMHILDVGCGSGNLAEVFYRNRFKPASYTGLEYRKSTVEACQDEFKAIPWAKFIQTDIVTQDLPKNESGYDLICSFEVMEHIGKQNVPIVLDKIKSVMSEKTIFLMSTPCYDEKVGAADNHTYDSGDGFGVHPQELTYHEMKHLLTDRFNIVNHWGTFASIRDYKHLMTPDMLSFYTQAHEYFDPNILSNLFAPFYPEHSRNVMWEVKLK